MITSNKRSDDHEGLTRLKPRTTILWSRIQIVWCDMRTEFSFVRGSPAKNSRENI